ncbi:MAG: hypothetical protein U0T81_17390 [Saprospiraceae bacterium]
MYREKLHFSFSKDITDRSKVFTCKEIGDNEAEIRVTDSPWVTPIRKTKIVIQNNTGIPDCKNQTVHQKHSIFRFICLTWFSSRDYNNVMLLASPLTGGNMSQGQGAGPGGINSYSFKANRITILFCPSSWLRLGIKDSSGLTVTFTIPRPMFLLIKYWLQILTAMQ